VPQTVTYRQALHDALRAELLRDDDVLLIGEEIGVFEGSYKITAGLLGEFGPRRIRDTPICEEGFTGAAVGAAMLGLRPVVEIMTINFSLLAIDQIINHAAKMHAMFGGQVCVPMVIRTPGGGGQQLAATHSQNLEVFYAHIPGLKVVAPSTPADAKGLLASAVRDDDPVIFLENLALYNTKGEVPDGDHTVPIGTAAVTKPGRDLTLVAYSRAAVIALDVARRLEDEGISAEVVDLRSLRPLDRATVCASVRRTGRAIMLEDDWLSYGIGAEIAATIQEGAFDYLDAPVRRVAAAEVPLPYAKPLELAALPDAAALTRTVREVLDATGFTTRPPRIGAPCPRSSCPACRTPWRKAPSAAGSSTRASRSTRATSSPRSKPTRPSWNWRRTTRGH
jgi:pyruvate dehydrogenase E1 component beta subunit